MRFAAARLRTAASVGDSRDDEGRRRGLGTPQEPARQTPGVYACTHARVKLHPAPTHPLQPAVRPMQPGPRRPRRGPDGPTRRRPEVATYTLRCGQALQPRVPRRSRRDARSDPRHLLRHPELHCPAVPGPAELDGADPGARAVRAGGQAHAPLGSVQARRRDRVQPAAHLDAGPDAVHQAGDRPARRQGRDPRRRPGVHQRRRARGAVHLQERRRRQRAHRGERPVVMGGAGGRAVRDGRPPREVRRFARLRADPRVERRRAAPSSGTGRSRRSGSCRPRRIPASRPPRPDPRRRW